MKRELIITLQASSSDSVKRYLDFECEKFDNAGYRLKLRYRIVSVERKVMIDSPSIDIPMSKPEIQQLVSELTKILLFDE